MVRREKNIPIKELRVSKPKNIPFLEKTVTVPNSCWPGGGWSGFLKALDTIKMLRSIEAYVYYYLY
jgi:hypothetical protein